MTLHYINSYKLIHKCSMKEKKEQTLDLQHHLAKAHSVYFDQ